MDLYELVTAILIADLATGPITDKSIPLSFAIIPIVALFSLEIILSFLSTKSSVCKKIFNNPPCILINKGKIDKKALLRTRITLEDLISQLRLKNISVIQDCEYAILEPDGSVSAWTRKAASPPDADDMSVEVQEPGMDHILVIDGVINKRGLAEAEKDEKWLLGILKRKGCMLSDTFLFTLDDLGNTNLIRKDG